MGKALGIVHRAIASHLIKKAGNTQKGQKQVQSRLFSGLDGPVPRVH
jgi:hypothetical protein